MRMAVVVVAALALAARPAAAADPKPKVAVLDLAANGASKELASAAGGVAATELDRLGVFKVITSDAIRDMLAFEKQRQMLGCADAGCMVEVGGALGVDYLVSGKVSRLGATKDVPETFTLELTLSSVKQGQREGSVIESARSESALMARAGPAVHKLVSRILAGRSGSLVITSTEAGAVVRVDEVVKGTTPLAGLLSVPSGPHQVMVEKQGFVAFQKEVQIQPGQVTEERANLVPSPDFIKEYESRQGKLRLGAWVSTGVAAVGAVAGAWFMADAARLYGNETTPGTFLYYRRQLDTNNTPEIRAKASSMASKVKQRQSLALVSWGTAGLAAAGATYLWIVGDDPRRYARYHQAAARLEATPLPGGALAALSIAF